MYTLLSSKPSEPEPFKIVAVMGCHVWEGILVLREIVKPTLENVLGLIITFCLDVIVINDVFR